MAEDSYQHSTPRSQDSNQRQFQIKSFTKLIRLQNQSGTLLLLFPSLWALVLASQGNPDPILVCVFVTGAFLMRSAGVILNDIADQSIDQKVQRTQDRPLASGVVSRKQALIFAMSILFLAFGLVCLLNPLTITLSPIALVLAAIYPFAKRYIHIPQLVLGIAFGWGAVMAWSAVQNQIETTTWLLFSATVCWAIAYDTIYALQDRKDDVKIGVKSSAILFGRYVWLGVAVASGMTIMFISLAGLLKGLSTIFYEGMFLITIFLGYQAWKLRREHSPANYFNMFKQHIWVGLALLISIWAGSL